MPGGFGNDKASARMTVRLARLGVETTTDTPPAENPKIGGCSRPSEPTALPDHYNCHARDTLAALPDRYKSPRLSRNGICIAPAEPREDAPNRFCGMRPRQDVSHPVRRDSLSSRRWRSKKEPIASENQSTRPGRATSALAGEGEDQRTVWPPDENAAAPASATS